MQGYTVAHLQAYLSPKFKDNPHHNYFSSGCSKIT